MRAPQGTTRPEPFHGDLLFVKVNKTLPPTPDVLRGRGVHKGGNSMAIFSVHFNTISRAAGQSAVASIAYQSGELLIQEKTGKKNYRPKSWQVKHTEINLPANAPQAFKDRSTLWNAVEQKERAKNARFARKAMIALPVELDLEDQISLVREYVRDTFVSQGMVADWAIHDKGDGNPHAHIQLTERAFTKTGKWAPKRKTGYKLDTNGERIPIIDPETGKQKLGARNRKLWERADVPYTDWDKPGKVDEWREAWTKTANAYLDRISVERIDHRSYQQIEEETGKEMPIPTIHEGYYARKIEKERPGSSWKIQYNRQVKEINQVALEAKELDQEIARDKEELARQKDRLGAALDEYKEELGSANFGAEAGRIETAAGREAAGSETGSRLVALTGRRSSETSRGQSGLDSIKQQFNGLARDLGQRKSELESRKRQFDKLTGRRDQQKPELTTASSRSQSRIEAVRRTVQEGLNGQSIPNTESQNRIIRLRKEVQRRLDGQQISNNPAQTGQGNPTISAPSMGLLDIIKQIITWLTERLERGRRQRAELERERQDLKVQIAAAEKVKKSAQIKDKVAKKPEKTAKVASRQPVQGQSNPVVHPDRPKEPQNRSIEHDQEQKAWRMAYTLCTIPSMLTLAARKGVAALMTLKKADTKQATASQKQAAIAKITKNLGVKGEFDYLAQQDFGKAYTSMLANYFVLGATGAFSTSEAVKTHEKGFVQYEKWFEDNQEPEKALEKYFKDAKQQAEKVLATYNRTPEKDFPRPQQTPPRRQSRGRSR